MTGEFARDFTIAGYHRPVPARPVLRCTVRGCGEPLACDMRAARCPRGHAFDRARGGYWNLLQPQDRRSTEAGDSAAAAQARRRLAVAGHHAPLFAAIGELLDEAGLAAGDALLDVGCGEGSLLAELAPPRGLAAHGVDLSRPSIEMAARLWPEATWVIANADRALPFVDASFDGLLSITSRIQAAEFARVLAPGGRLVLAVPGADDLIELRAVVKGEGVLRDRLESALAPFAGSFDVVVERRCSWRLDLDRAGLEYLLASSYRGARASERARFSAVESSTVTMSRDLALLRARPHPGPSAALGMRE
jgi:23S rRNA (guanine745-N1)-methyltransferase